jgi:hypothetical protein
VTQDVDAITEVRSLADYYRLADDLRAVGFVEDQTQGAPMCRWRAPGIILDVMGDVPVFVALRGFGEPPR